MKFRAKDPVGEISWKKYVTGLALNSHRQSNVFGSTCIREKYVWLYMHHSIEKCLIQWSKFVILGELKNYMKHDGNTCLFGFFGEKWLLPYVLTPFR